MNFQRNCFQKKKKKKRIFQGIFVLKKVIFKGILVEKNNFQRNFKATKDTKHIFKGTVFEKWIFREMLFEKYIFRVIIFEFNEFSEGYFSKGLQKWILGRTIFWKTHFKWTTFLGNKLFFRGTIFPINTF